MHLRVHGATQQILKLDGKSAIFLCVSYSINFSLYDICGIGLFQMYLKESTEITMPVLIYTTISEGIRIMKEFDLKVFSSEHENRRIGNKQSLYLSRNEKKFVRLFWNIL